MKNLILIYLFIFSSLSFSQPSVSWVQDTRGVSIAIDHSNNVYTVDYEYNPAGDIYLTKRNSSGNFLWVASFNQTENSKWEKATWVETDNAGNIIVTGNLMSGYSNPVNAAAIIMKFDPSGNLLWRNVYENSFDGSYTKKCIIDAGNNIYVLGAGSSTLYGFTTKVKKFAPNGSDLWTYYNGSGIGGPHNFKFAPDNSIIITGRSFYGSVNGYAKIDLNGNQIWSISGINSLTAGDAAGDASGNSYLVHAEYVSNPRTTIRKIGPAGNQLWLNNYNIAAQRVEVGSDNMPVAVGYPNQGSFGSSFIKVDPNGNQVWLNINADGAYNLLLHAQLKMDSQNNIYLAAGTMTEMAICKVNSNGSSGWTLTMPGSYANGFTIGSDNNVYVVGGTTAKITQGTLCQIPADLNSELITQTSVKLIWNLVPGSQKYEISYRAIIKNGDRNSWIKKFVKGNNYSIKLSELRCNTNYNWRIRTVCDSTGSGLFSDYSALQSFNTLNCTGESAIQETESDNLQNEDERNKVESSNSFYLNPVYPNPFNPETKITFGINAAAHVKIVIYNSLGLEEAVLINEFKSKGQYVLTWNGNSSSGGIYFLQFLINGNLTGSEKMMLLK